MNKKAAEMSLNVIIIAILVIIVLVVVVIIFSGRINIFGKTIASCQAQGGYCTSPQYTSVAGISYPACPAGETMIKNTDCGEQICCLKVFS